jgi:hypothetical protein
MLSKCPPAKKELWAVFFLSLPPILLYVPIHLFAASDSMAAIPSSLAHFAGIIHGWLIYKHSKRGVVSAA